MEFWGYFFQICASRIIIQISQSPPVKTNSRASRTKFPRWYFLALVAIIVSFRSGFIIGGVFPAKETRGRVRAPCLSLILGCKRGWSCLHRTASRRPLTQGYCLCEPNTVQPVDVCFGFGLFRTSQIVDLHWVLREECLLCECLVVAFLCRYNLPL